MTGVFNHCKSFKESFHDNCIELVVSAYQKALIENSVSINWEENDITVQLHEYIDKDQFRRKKHIFTNVESHLTNTALPKERGFADKYSRIDMHFSVFKSDNDYHCFAEAKLLKEQDSTLKRRYITTGIDSFTSRKYYDGFLIAYIMEGVLINTVEGVNKLLKKDNRNAEILIRNTCKYHNEYYESKHSSIGILKHFMFDFTGCGIINA
ncbi:MAG: hypothetical protein LBG22_03580 [Treponema sp.]|jgi:hypothetical protein|nr:hypothetical protein [Treponema sp.]